MKAVAKRPWSEDIAWLEVNEQESYRDHKVSKVHFPSDNMTEEQIAEMMNRPTYDPHKN